MMIEHHSINMAYRGLIIVVVFTLTCSVLADNAHNKGDRSEFKKSLGKNCDDSYSLTCLKLDAVSWVDKLSENKDISVLPGVSFVKENSGKANTGDIVAELAREFPDDPNARLDGYLAKKISGFFENHSMKLNLWKAVQSYQSDSQGTARRGGGGGGGGKKGGGGGGGMGMVFAAGAMMKGMMMSMALAAVAALAGKALMAALAALLLAAVASLKGQGGGGGGHSTYEVISKPIYTSSHSHSTSHEGGGGGWDGYGGHGRSLENAPLPLGLQPGYQPA